MLLVDLTSAKQKKFSSRSLILNWFKFKFFIKVSLINKDINLAKMIMNLRKTQKL